MYPRHTINIASQSPGKGLFICSSPPAYTTNYLTKLNKQGLSLPPDCQAEVRVRQYTGTGDEYYDAVPWMVVDMSGPQQLSMPVDKVAVGAGGNTLLEMRFVLNTGADFPSGTTAHINTYYIYVTHYTPQTLITTICDEKDNYRYGFNDMEKDNEVKGLGNSYDFGARIYSSRLGRWASIDPLAAKYPSLSTYNFTANSPIVNIDPDGKKIFIYYMDESGNNKSYEYGSKIKLPNNPFVLETVQALDKLNSAKSISEKFSFLKTTTDYNINISQDHQTISYFGASEYKKNDGSKARIARTDQDVRFNERLGLKDKNSESVLAPYGALWHELGHIYNGIKDPDGFNERKKNTYNITSPDARWHNEEEKYNTINNEHPLAEEDGMLIRDEHDGSQTEIIKTKNSTSVE